MFGNSKAVKPPEQKLGGFRKDRVATNQAARVLPWIGGIHWIGVTWIGDVFNVRTTEVKESIGKGGSATIGHNYYASFAGLVCGGVVSSIFDIFFGDEVVWTGAIVRGVGEDSVDITIENRGIFHFYYGTETQALDPLLAASGQLHNPYRGQAYFVAEDIFLGQDVTVVPTVQVGIGRIIAPSWLPGGELMVNSTDLNPVAVLWDWWSDKRYGLGRDENDLDQATLIDTAHQCYVEGLGVSPILSEPTEMKEAILRLLEYVDGYPTSYGGKFGFKLSRASGGTPPLLTPSDWINEPRISSQSWRDTYDKVVLKFTDYTAHGIDNAVKHDDLANYELMGTHRTLELDRPWFTVAQMALKVAASQGRQMSIAKMDGRVSIRQSAASDILVGTEFQLQTRDGIVLDLKCTEREKATPENPVVDIAFESSQNWSNASFHVPTEEPLPTRPVFGANAAEAVNILDSPYALGIQRFPNLTFFVARGDTYGTAYDVWKSSESSGTYESKSSRDAGNAFTYFACHCKLTAAYDADTPVVDDVIGIELEVQGLDTSLLDEEYSEADGFAHKLLGFFGATATEIMSLYNVVKVSPSNYTANVLRGLYDTKRRSHADNSVVWLQARTNLQPYAWPPYSEDPRYYKIQPRFRSASVDLGTITPVAHTENARTFLPIGPRNVRVDGDGSHATWISSGDAELTWSNTSRARTVFGLPLNEATPTDLDEVIIQIWDYTGASLLDSFRAPAAPEAYTLTLAYLTSTVGADFMVRVYGCRGGWTSLDYDELQVVKV